jgi:hypothetical protein
VHRTDRRLPANEVDTDDQNAIAAPKLAVGASLESPVPVVYSKRQKRL